MAASSTQLKPVETPPPHAPSGDFMTTDQWDVWHALLDGALPAVTSKSRATGDRHQVVLPDDEFDRLLEEASKGLLPDGPGAEDVVDFFASRLGADPLVRDDCLRMLARSPARSKLAGVMGILNTRVGSLLFTGYWNPITDQPTAVRHAILQSWSQSRFTILKGLSRTITSLAAKAAVATNQPFHRLSGYTDIPRNWSRVEGFAFDFIQPGPGDEPHVIETDVVIVGSGPGGGVSAKNIAEAGHRVLVVDRGHYFPPSQLPMSQTASSQHMFENGGALATENGFMSLLAGSTWGGGGTINWSVALRPQDYVRKQWADEGLSLFGSGEYDECLDRICEFVGVGTDGVRHNHRNKLLLDASEKLGWKAFVVPQNTGNQEHDCGQCSLGCGSAVKKGPAVCWLPAAAEAGAQFMEGFTAERVTFGEDGKTATGVEGLWVARDKDGSVIAPEEERVKRRVQIRAKRVIVSSGSLRSPLLLARSGVENPQVGRNLHLHPVAMATATFDERTNGWEGGIITACNNEFENLDGEGHGVKIQPACMVPYTSISMYPWSSGIDYKMLMARYSRVSTFMAITRDRDTGRVFADPATGTPRIDYAISDHDRDHAIEGLAAIVKMLYISGATEIQPHIHGLERFTVDRQAAASFLRRMEEEEVRDPEFADPKLAAYLSRLRGMGSPAAGGDRMRRAPSAHQMGSCRMSTSPEDGVVDEGGKVWGREGLYVADASVLPSATGVNPMITVMATADWISRGVRDGL